MTNRRMKLAAMMDQAHAAWDSHLEEIGNVQEYCEKAHSDGVDALVTARDCRIIAGVLASYIGDAHLRAHDAKEGVACT